MPKPTSQFYKDLRALDQAMADRWKRTTNDNPNRKLDFEMMVVIVGWSRKKEITKKGNKINRLMYSHLLNENQAKAVVLLMKKMGDEKEIFSRALEEADSRGTLFVPNPAFSPNAVKRITDIIFLSAHAINWRSPGSQFSYSTPQYSAVAELIKSQAITVVDLADGGLRTSDLASYHPTQNVLKLKTSRSDAEIRYLLFHELTHAVQDWYDLKSIGLYMEVDAFIGGAVASRTLGERIKKGDPLYDTAFTAAEFVFYKEARITNLQWVFAYTAVMREVEKHYPHSHRPYSNVEAEDKSRMSEPERINAVIRRLEAETEARQRRQLEVPLGPNDGPPIPIR